MSALALQLPESLMQESMEFAKKLNMSRSEFIRMALKDEIQKVKRQFEEEEMLKAFKAMAKSPQYLQEAEELDQISSDLPIETAGEGKWWQKP